MSQPDDDYIAWQNRNSKVAAQDRHEGRIQ